ncbi:helix-turn-helix domain-containing protein [Brevibacterium sp. RIT 803]|uniref:helix-turn-helix domain-containing protein n=1 Tax=unclassified Brevibacterium TaxID=2614124 RepID=UPI0019528386|nr:helix-turn-helix transcriptional regulator [Brevibacterium sp. RIT 803]MCF2588669.1 helix-turn-helix transcriptional regulator [Brevibacterium sp. UCMA 11752]
MSNDSDPDASIGDRLRRRRKALHLTLEQVAKAAGITTGYLSQLERGRSSGSVSTLQKICGVLKLTVGDLFESNSDTSRPVLRFADAGSRTFGQGASKFKLTPAHFDHLEVLLGVFEPGGNTGSAAYTHGASEELLLVLDGNVEVEVDGEEHRLGPLDSMTYNSSQPHKVSESTGTSPATVTWTMAPPTY